MWKKLGDKCECVLKRGWGGGEVELYGNHFDIFCLFINGLFALCVIITESESFQKLKGFKVDQILWTLNP